jgi:hypothetical protein
MNLPGALRKIIIAAIKTLKTQPTIFFAFIANSL